MISFLAIILALFIGVAVQKSLSRKPRHHEHF